MNYKAITLFLLGLNIFLTIFWLLSAITDDHFTTVLIDLAVGGLCAFSANLNYRTYKRLKGN